MLSPADFFPVHNCFLVTRHKHNYEQKFHHTSRPQLCQLYCGGPLLCQLFRSSLNLACTVINAYSRCMSVYQLLVVIIELVVEELVTLSIMHALWR